jgi:hypothetical protein
VVLIQRRAPVDAARSLAIIEETSTFVFIGTLTPQSRYARFILVTLQALSAVAEIDAAAKSQRRIVSAAARVR